MDWNQCYLDDHTPWDKGSAAPPLLEWLDANPGAIEGRVLVPGCGLGHDNRALAGKTGAREIVGIDVSGEALERARGFETVGAESYELADLFDLPPRFRGAFDWIWEHTCFCAIDPDRRDDYVEATWSALAPGGFLLAVFYLDPYDEEHPPGGGPPHGCREEELMERFVKSGRFAPEERYVPGRAYEGREGLELVMRFRRVG